jgi:hypothetical protein
VVKEIWPIWMRCSMSESWWLVRDERVRVD